jgi:hypothetical protein
MSTTLVGVEGPTEAMSLVIAPLAVVPYAQGPSQPDAAWIKKNVSVFAVARALGLCIRHRRVGCLRPENHAHGDADPSLHLYERGNRWRCFVCELRGSNIDLVMEVLHIPFGDAVRWIADRFTVPDIKPGRPVGHRSGDSVQPYRVGVHGSEFEILVRSGMFGRLSPAERSILVVLAVFRDPDSGFTRMSYAAIGRYAGVGSSATISRSLKKLARLHAIETHAGTRVGLIRECSGYRVILEDLSFLSHCNEVSRRTRQEVEQERCYRRELRRNREKESRELRAKATSSSVRPTARQAYTRTFAGHRRFPAPFLSETPNLQGQSLTCEGQDLSSRSEVTSNKPLQCVKRETDFGSRRHLQQTQAEEIRAKHGASQIEGRDS